MINDCTSSADLVPGPLVPVRVVGSLQQVDHSPLFGRRFILILIPLVFIAMVSTRRMNGLHPIREYPPSLQFEGPGYLRRRNVLTTVFVP